MSFDLGTQVHYVQRYVDVIEFLENAANQLDGWAAESQSGGWSTHQVERNRRLADECRRMAAGLRRP
jgi:3-methyladenine DNA glycosylase AlkC